MASTGGQVASKADEIRNSFDPDSKEGMQRAIDDLHAYAKEMEEDKGERFNYRDVVRAVLARRKFDTQV